MNEWTQAAGSFLDPAVVQAAFCLDGPALDRDRACSYGSYIAALDLVVVHDLTVFALGHREGDRVVLDRMQSWKGSRRHPVDFVEVEEFIVQAHRRFGFKLRLDPWQGLDLAQRLRARSVRAEEFTFTTASKQKLAASPLSTVNSGSLLLYEAEGLRDELLALRLVQTSAGAWAFDHARGGHDDRAVALALMVVALLERPAVGSGYPVFGAPPSPSRWDVTGDAWGPRPQPVARAEPEPELEDVPEDFGPPPPCLVDSLGERVAKLEWSRMKGQENERKRREADLARARASRRSWRLHVRRGGISIAPRGPDEPPVRGMNRCVVCGGAVAGERCGRPCTRISPPTRPDFGTPRVPARIEPPSRPSRKAARQGDRDGEQYVRGLLGLPRRGRLGRALMSEGGGVWPSLRA